MKCQQFLITTLALCLELAACRPERRTTGTIAKKQSGPELVSDRLPQQQDAHENATPSVIDPFPIAKHSAPLEGRELSDDEKLLRIAELERAEVFDVSVPAQVAKERAEAWGKLSVVDTYTIISKDRYLYAQKLLVRYRQAPVVEKLVFWRLLDLRLHHQGISGTSTIPGDDYRDLRLEMYPKLMAMLYSAIGETPETLPDYLAIRKGIEMLKAAAPRENQTDK